MLCYSYKHISYLFSKWSCKCYSIVGGEEDEDVEDESEEDRGDVIKKKQEDLEKEKRALLENHSMLEEVYIIEVNCCLCASGITYLMFLAVFLLHDAI